MSIEITARHMNISSTIQEYAKTKAEQMVADFPRVEHLHVILDHQKHLFVAEIVVQGRNHIRLEAEHSSDDMRASLDHAFDRAERQLRRERDKILDHHRRDKQGVGEDNGFIAED